MARNGRNMVIYKGTFVSNQSLCICNVVYMVNLSATIRGVVLSPRTPRFLGPCEWLTEYWKPTLSLTIHSSSKFSASVVPLRQDRRKVWKWWGWGYMCDGHNLPPVWNRVNGFKVHIFWEGHKIGSDSPACTSVKLCLNPNLQRIWKEKTSNPIF